MIRYNTTKIQTAPAIAKVRTWMMILDDNLDA